MVNYKRPISLAMNYFLNINTLEEDIFHSIWKRVSNTVRRAKKRQYSEYVVKIAVGQIGKNM